MNEPNYDGRWWRPELKEDRARHVLGVVRRIYDAQAFRRDLHLRHARLYGNLPLLGLGPRNYTRKALQGAGASLALNVCRSCSDTYVAKLTKDRPKVTFLTSGATWKEQQQAENLERYIDGVFYETQTYEMDPLLALDSAVWGQGHVEAMITRDDRIRHERCLPWEVLADDEEAMYGDPPNIYRQLYADKGRLIELYPEKRAEIESATGEYEAGESVYDTVARQVLVRKAWHAPSGPKAGDGLHVVCISTPSGQGVLSESAYDLPMLPIVPLRRAKPLIGWWGTGIVQELVGIQLEINILLQKIQRSHHLLGAGHWLLENTAKINSNKIDNDIGSIIRFTGRPPVLQVGMSVAPEIYQHLDRLYSRAFEIVGISQQMAQATMPKGLEGSGRAQQVYADINSERFQPNYREYQHFHLALARLDIEMSRRLGNYGVRATAKRNMVILDWKDLDLPDEEFILKLYPTNLLANDPSTKLAQVEQMTNAGWIPPDDAMRLLDFPDTQAYANDRNASYNLIQDIIADILDKGEYMGPEPFMDLGVPPPGQTPKPGGAVFLMQLAYLRGKREKRPEDRLRKLIEWMEEAKQIVEEANKPTMPEGGGGPPVQEMPAQMGGQPPVGPGMPPPEMPPPGGPPGMPPPGMQEAA